MNIEYKKTPPKGYVLFKELKNGELFYRDGFVCMKINFRSNGLYCYVRLSDGVFVEPKWIELAEGLWVQPIKDYNFVVNEKFYES